MSKRQRVIGTTVEAIQKAEQALGRALPPSFTGWLTEHNGLDLENVHIYPIRDERDIRKTWESIVHNYQNGWAAWLETFLEEKMEFSHLLPFADFGTGDYYCFDCHSHSDGGEYAIVHWSHETGETTPRASTFADFVEKVSAGEFDDD